MTVSLTPELEKFVSAKSARAATTPRVKLSAKLSGFWRNTTPPARPNWRSLTRN
jgi:hypothetical protein